MLWRAVPILGVLVSAILAAWAGVWVLAHEAGKIAPEYTQRWERQGWIGDEGEWDLAYQWANEAGRLNPFSPEYELSLAGLYLWRAEQQRLWPQHANGQRDRALTHITKALSRRPVWANAWLLYAQVKLDKEEFDPVMETALRHAMNLAPWDKVIHHDVVPLGMFGWTQLSDETRKLFTLTVARALTHSELNAHVRRSAKHFEWGQQLASLVGALSAQEPGPKR